MPGKVKVKILAGRNLPVMDRSSDTTDAYVEVKIGNNTYKTEVFRKSLNPQWNSEWFIFEVDDLELQDEPLQIRLMDHDTYSADDAIGKVYIDLNPLIFIHAPPHQSKCSSDASSSSGTMSGWLPVFDTMHGIRGEVNVLVKLDLFSDVNKFRQSSCGVQFFFTAEIPSGFRCNQIIGFTEELVVNDDPEYQWIDKIRTPRASNEARQTLFSKLSGELRRRIGVKVQDQGGNAVIGYRQCFDLEGESGIVVRGIGSIVSLARVAVEDATSTAVSRISGAGQNHSLDQPAAEQGSLISPKRHSSRVRKISEHCPPKQPPTGDFADELSPQCGANGVLSTSPNQEGHIRRSSDSDISLNAKGCGLQGNVCCSTGKPCCHGHYRNGPKSLTLHDSFSSVIYPFLTMKAFPPEFIVHLGGTVSARSVKILDKSHIPADEVDSRDSWWSQIRTEIRSHARSIACNVVLGYEEFTTICDDICVLNATGTAAVIDICSLETDNWPNSFARPAKDAFLSTSAERRDEFAPNAKIPKDSQQQSGVYRSHPNVVEDMSDGLVFKCDAKATPTQVKPPPSQANVTPTRTSACSLCHIPYSEKANPFNGKISKCAVCKVGKVPDILLTTLELPPSIPFTGQGCVIQARVVRFKKDLKGELNAKEISESLPFLEYELHKQLYHKIMIKGMNSLFGLRVRVTVGEKMVVGVGTGTAVFLTPLPPPTLPKVTKACAGALECDKSEDVQRKLHDLFDRNKGLYGLGETGSGESTSVFELRHSDTEDSDEDKLEFDLSCGTKGAFVLDLDDEEDLEMLNLLTEETRPHRSLFASTTQLVPGLSLDQSAVNLQMFTRIWMSKVPQSIPRPIFSHYFDSVLQSVFFKVRNLTPCVVSGLKVDVALPEPDELQISVVGVIIGQGLPYYHKKPAFAQAQNGGQSSSTQDFKKKKMDDSELMFAMEGVRGADDRPVSNPDSWSVSGLTNGSSGKNSASALPGCPSSSDVPSLDSTASLSSSSSSSGCPSVTKRTDKTAFNACPGTSQFGVDITPLSFVPGAGILRPLSNLNFFFIRESTCVKENGGLSAFVGSFVTEVLALVRAHVAALGGNALISYFLNKCILLHNPHKNQAQCLINVGGDIVQVSYRSATSNHHASLESCQQLSNQRDLGSV